MAGSLRGWAAFSSSSIYCTGTLPMRRYVVITLAVMRGANRVELSLREISIGASRTNTYDSKGNQPLINPDEKDKEGSDIELQINKDDSEE